MQHNLNFNHNRKFRRDYDSIFRKDPAAANVFLLLAELADENGRVVFNTPTPESEIARLMTARFNDCRAYQLPGGLKR